MFKQLCLVVLFCFSFSSLYVHMHSELAITGKYCVISGKWGSRNIILVYATDEENLKFI